MSQKNISQQRRKSIPAEAFHEPRWRSVTVWGEASRQGAGGYGTSSEQWKLTLEREVGSDFEGLRQHGEELIHANEDHCKGPKSPLPSTTAKNTSQPESHCVQQNTKRHYKYLDIQ